MEDRRDSSLDTLSAYGFRGGNDGCVFEVQGGSMIATTLEHRYRYMTRVNWTAVGNLAGVRRGRINNIATGRRKSKRLSALLETMELPRKIDWNAVAANLNRYLPRPYPSRYIREVACGYRANKRLKDTLTRAGILEMVEKQKSFSSSTNKQEVI